MTITTKNVRTASGKNEYRFVLKNGAYVAEAVRSVSRAFVPTVITETWDVMNYHRFLVHTNEQQTRAAAKILGTVLTGGWEQCIECSRAKVHRAVVPKKAKVKPTTKAGGVFIDLSGLKSKKIIKVSLYVMIIVDNFTRINWVRFILSKDQTGDVQRNLIADVVQPEELAIEDIRTDEGGEFQGDF